jgi:hypothetical protein
LNGVKRIRSALHAFSGDSANEVIGRERFRSPAISDMLAVLVSTMKAPR